MGLLVTLSCGVMGNILILKRASMLGDGLSHAVLPGIALAYLLTKSLELPVLITGALIVSLLANSLIQLLSSNTLLKMDTIFGIIFPLFFSIGIILVTLFAQSIDLDLDCVLYGDIVFTPLKKGLQLFGYGLGPICVWQLFGIFLLCLLLLWLFYKELVTCSFDPNYARTLGMRERVIHYAYMSLLAIVIVACFEAVGSILVLTMLVFPGATASLLTRKLKAQLLVSALLSIPYSLGGISLGIWLNSSISASMGVIALVIFALAFGTQMLKKT